MTDRPIACSLDAAALAARRAGLLAELNGLAITRSDLPDGQRMTFAPSTVTLELIARAIEAERECCRFLQFRLTVEPDLGAFVLELTGPLGTREFLSSIFDSA
jgi:hypothetical protein